MICPAPRSIAGLMRLIWLATIVVAASAAMLTAAVADALDPGTVGRAYFATFSGSGGTPPYSYSLIGTLPPGLQLSTSGSLSGTPTGGGSFNFTVTVTDKNGDTGSQALTMIVYPPTIAVTPAALPAGTGGIAYSLPLSAGGGTAPYSFAVTAGSTLPPGFSLSTDGVLSGNPTASGTYNFTVTAKDSSTGTGPYSVSKAYMLTVAAPTISISPAALPNGTGGVFYSRTLSASDGTAAYSYAVTAGALPNGLTLNTNGTLSGTPNEAGDFNLTVTATDANGFTGSQPYTLAISAPVPVAPNKSVSMLAGTSASVSLTSGVSGGPFTAATIVTPPNPADGTASITGGGGAYELVFASAASASGAVAISYTLSNNWGASAPATVTFNVAPRPDPSQDPEVIGLINAQVDSARRFAKAQIRNFNDRLEQLHDEGDRRNNSFNVQVGMTDTEDTGRLGYMEERRPDPADSSFGPLAFTNDGAAGTALAGSGGSVGRTAFWVGGFVNFGRRDDGALDLHQTLVGISGGVDYRFSPHFIGGIGFGYGHDAADVGQNGTQSDAQASAPRSTEATSRRPVCSSTVLSATAGSISTVAAT